MAISTINVTITGIAPLLMHSGQMCDPLNPIVRQMKELTSSRKKTDETYERMAYLEFVGGLWIADGRPAIPSHALEANFKEAAKATRQGKNADRGAWVDGDAAELIYQGPREPAALWEQRAKYALTVRARVQKASVMRTRPIFREWSASFELCYEPSLFNRSAVEKILIEAGRCGLGDWRPKYGRFECSFK